ncbi:MAG: tetratricopeptide repeat protein [Bacteroidales bacterium]|nr:tetratricopeptide repeat protein [Bacteroidales bacterium]
MMKTNLKIFLFTSVVVLLLACKSNENKMLERIADLENLIKADSLQMPDKVKVTELINSYDEFAQNFPDNEKTPEFLFNAGKYAMSYNMSEKAIGFFDKIITNYPQYEKHADSFFLKGFVYDSQLSNIPMAKATYEAFIEAYPDHDLAIEAGYLIELLGKPMEEIIAGFEAQNNLNKDTTEN